MVLMVLFYYRVENSFFNEGICQYYRQPYESAVTIVLNELPESGLHLSVVTGFWLTQQYFSTTLSEFPDIYLLQCHR
jgi:hypothetical protein